MTSEFATHPKSKAYNLALELFEAREHYHQLRQMPGAVPQSALSRLRKACLEVALWNTVPFRLAEFVWAKTVVRMEKGVTDAD